MAQYTRTKIDIKNIKRGDTLDLPFSVGDAFDLTDCVGKCQVRTDALSTKVILEVDVVIEIDADGQRFYLRKHYDDMNIAENTYVYDVQFTTPDDERHTVQEGKFQVGNDVSR